jgi:hypothetical protein
MSRQGRDAAMRYTEARVDSLHGAEISTALRKLANEVGGLRAFEPQVRAAIGNTNWEVLMHHQAEALAVLGSAHA